MFLRETETDRIRRIVSREGISEADFIASEIRRFRASPKYRDMLRGNEYYAGRHDILRRRRLMIGGGGELEEVKNLPNNRIVDNQYRKLVRQKVNYLLGQPFALQTEREGYAEALSGLFGRKFFRTLKSVGRDSLNCGIGWVFFGYGEDGEPCFRRLRPWELVPGWADEEHTRLDYAIRFYCMTVPEGRTERRVEKAEIYDARGIRRYIRDGGAFVPDDGALPSREPYFTAGAQGFNWSRIPLIPFKRDGDETPLIRGVKSLQDGLNLILSNFQNGMEEDARNTILVLVNYDGERLDEFRRNLSTYGAVKVKTVDGAPGDLRTLQIEVNAENYRTILEIFKKAIIENGMGYDAKDDRLSGTPNQMNIQSMYSDIDLDANAMETEYQAAFEDLLFFVNAHLANSGAGDFRAEDVEVLFNRDILINESEAIEGVRNSVGILSEETLVSQHPWVDDPAREMQRKAKEAARALDAYDMLPGGADDAE